MGQTVVEFLNSSSDTRPSWTQYWPILCMLDLLQTGLPKSLYGKKKKKTIRYWCNTKRIKTNDSIILTIKIKYNEWEILNTMNINWTVEKESDHMVAWNILLKILIGVP